ncbi:hypothetical protein FBU59_004457 [Linderina macrospora]|uniref:Uncharacterized protein n=1 Tax=Linderina macrospora TaxID=4868 RepID=A0ACC1J5F9_9FUNG|nr:hypothetical protein FBU59_004457 [Linderina macrospora]
MADIDIELLKSECRKVVETGDVDKLTDRIIRRTLEKRLDLAEKHLDQPPYKQVLKETATEAVTAIVVKRNATVQEEETQNDSLIPTAEEEESEMSEVFDEEPVVRKRKAPAATNSTSKRSKNSPTSTSKSSSTTIANLKSYIGKCGVRKVWVKELSGMNGAQQVRHLKELLAELGMEGRPTLEKCKKIKEKREMQAELAAMDSHNIIDEEKELAPVEALRDRRAAARRQVKYTLESDEESEVHSQDEGGRDEEEEEEEDIPDSEESEAYAESESEDEAEDEDAESDEGEE